MKYITSTIVGFIALVLLSFIATPYINDLYIYIYKIEPGPDGETELFKFLFYVQWPIFFTIGLVLGYLLHVKCLTKTVT